MYMEGWLEERLIWSSKGDLPNISGAGTYPSSAPHHCDLKSLPCFPEQTPYPTCFRAMAVWTSREWVLASSAFLVKSMKTKTMETMKTMKTKETMETMKTMRTVGFSDQAASAELLHAGLEAVAIELVLW